MSVNSKWQIKFSSDFAQSAEQIELMPQKVTAMPAGKQAHLEQLRVDFGRNANIKPNHIRQKHRHLRNNQTPSRK